MINKYTVRKERIVTKEIYKKQVSLIVNEKERSILFS